MWMTARDGGRQNANLRNIIGQLWQYKRRIRAIIRDGFQMIEFSIGWSLTIALVFNLAINATNRLTGLQLMLTVITNYK